MRFFGLGLSDPVPDANTIWTFREALNRATLGLDVGDRGAVPSLRGRAQEGRLAPVAEDGFEEAHLERAPEIDDAETVCVRDALTSVAEAAHTTAEAERIRVARLVEASPDLFGRDLVEVERT